ncbi:hypothetical protein SAMN04488095_1401 [Jannaschia pohangensis]|uniref:Adenylate kinase n=2 Tax=Jannaschia pohangensis TaxID=390807 RepID=A0A1I3JQZ4_9RHOB|nr:hypothetical protein SAMN04488095_1401 [Jannaschia pohangensis]
MIIGQPGSGKSTLAREVGEIAHLPVFHMDHIHWQPGWVERSPDEKDVLCSQIHSMDRWVFEGGHRRSWPERLARADTVIWLDMPVTLRLWRVTRRTLRYNGRSRPDLPPDCPERLNAEFYGFIWRTRTSGREKCAALFDMTREDQARHHFTSAKAVRGYLHALRYVARRGNLGISHR